MLRPGLVVSRRTFYGCMSVLLAVLGFFYWLYLQQLTHAGGLLMSRLYPRFRMASAPAASPAGSVAAAAKKPVVTSPMSPMPAAKPAIPQTELAPVAAKPVVATPAERLIVGKGILIRLPPVTASVQKPAIQPQPQRFSERDPLMRAGNLAFGNLMDVANSHPDACGFLPDDVLLDARLGDPIPVYQIAAPDRARYQAGQPVKPLLKPADRWVFPVLIGTEIRCMVQVTRSGDKSNYVLGGPSKMLGVAWNKILQKWPAAEGFHPQLLINPEIPGYYFSVPELPDQNITDTDQMIYSPDSLSPAAVILASWR